MEKSIFEQMGGTYYQQGDYLLPNLVVPESVPIGIWGQRHLQYLKKHRQAVYTAMLLSGELNPAKMDIQPIIVSTSSIALQNAVQNEYLPLLSDALMEDGLTDQPLCAMIRKGKSHYVCDHRLERRLGQLNLSKKNWKAGRALLSPGAAGYGRRRPSQRL